jgi:GDP-L-fucose synthase
MMPFPPPPLLDTAWWRGRKVVVTGGTGFIGSHVVERLAPFCAQVLVPTRPGSPQLPASVRGDVAVMHGDLADEDFARRSCAGTDTLLMLAATVGGIAWNQTHPATLFRDNLRPFLTTLEAARAAGVSRVLAVSSVTVYPREAPVPTPEEAGFQGLPEPSSDGYGWAKRMQEFAVQAYAREFGLSVAVVRPNNAYGPRDDFRPETARVVPSLLRKALDPETPTVEVWGSGQQSRSFMYVTDTADGLLRACERAPDGEAINLGGEQEVTIAELAALAVEVAGTGKPLVFRTDRPEGQLRRHGDVTRQARLLDFHPRVGLREGLTATLAWYRSQLAR